LACQVEHLDTFRREVINYLNRKIGFDRSCILTPPSYSNGVTKPKVATNFGMDPGCVALAIKRPERFDQEMNALISFAANNQGVAIDTEVFSPRELKRSALYEEVMRPHRGRSSLYAFLTVRGEKLATLILGRCGSDFNIGHRERLQPLVCNLALAEKSYQIKAQTTKLEQSCLPAILSVREQEIVGYIRLGLTNKEIASLSNRSPNTVRNQLSAVYQKCGVTNRSELVSLCLGGLPGERIGSDFRLS